MRNRTRQGHIEDLLVLLLFAVFATALLLVLLAGADSYRRVAQRGDDGYNRRLCVQYVAAKVRHSDVAGGVFVGGFSAPDAEDGISTLYLRQQINGTDYDTRIYWYDGAVRELFAQAGGDFQPQDGDAVLPAAALTFAQEDGLLTVEAQTEDGTRSSLVLSVRSTGEVAP